MITRRASMLTAALMFGWGLWIGTSGAVAQVDPASLITATVTRVIDGMSLDARVFDRRTAVGYLGAETLPSNQPCGQQALARNRELTASGVLLLEDATYQFDGYGRRLFYAFTPDGQSIDEILIREGLARAVRTDASRGPALAAAQAEAEAAGRGCLWGDGA